MISRRSLLVAPALILPSCRLARAQSLGAGSSGGSFDPNAIIVAPNGNNANQGTLTRPVASLTRAQALVRNSRATKTVYLRAGTYNQTSTLVLTTADNGETWATYPGDPVGSAVLDYTNQAFKGTYAGLGSPNGCAIMAKGTSNLTIDSITVQNHPAIGILCYGGSPGFGFMPRAASASNVTVRNCSFINGGYGAFPPSYPGNDGQNVASGSGVYATEVPSVWFCGTLSGGLVIHNYFKTHVGTPVVIQASGVVEVSHNYLQDLNRACFDTGAIYSQFTNGCSFIYNYIRDAKSATSYDAAHRAAQPKFRHRQRVRRQHHPLQLRRQSVVAFLRLVVSDYVLRSVDADVTDLRVKRIPQLRRRLGLRGRQPYR